MDPKEFALDAEAVTAIAKEVGEGLKSTIAETVKEAVKTEVDTKMADLEKVNKKDINGGTENKEANINGGKSSIENMSKELRFMYAVKALNSGDSQKLAEFNKYAIQSKKKTGYNNETVDADGGYLIPAADFEAEVETLSPNYGVALRDADVRRINGNSIKTNKRGDNVVFTEVNSEAGTKPATKMTFSQVDATLREFAGIALGTNRLSEDSAVDFWAEITKGFAEAYAKLADQLVFTDNHALYPGLFFKDGVAVETIGASISGITWDDLMNCEVKIPSKALQNSKYYMEKTVFNILRQTKASTAGNYMAMPVQINGTVQTPSGVPIELCDILPNSSTVGDANEPFGVFGDLKRNKLYIKNGMILTKASEATVHDTDGNAINLFEKNMQALRAEVRMVNMVKFPEAFCLFGTGTVS